MKMKHESQAALGEGDTRYVLRARARKNTARREAVAEARRAEDHGTGVATATDGNHVRKTLTLAWL